MKWQQLTLLSFWVFADETKVGHFRSQLSLYVIYLTLILVLVVNVSICFDFQFNPSSIFSDFICCKIRPKIQKIRPKLTKKMKTNGHKMTKIPPVRKWSKKCSNIFFLFSVQSIFGVPGIHLSKDPGYRSSAFSHNSGKSRRQSMLLWRKNWQFNSILAQEKTEPILTTLIHEIFGNFQEQEWSTVMSYARKKKMKERQKNDDIFS